MVNDSDLSDLSLLSHVYNDRNLIDVDVNLHEQPSRRKLSQILKTPCDFLHYVGRATEKGLAYRDGVLDYRWIDDFGPKAFFVQGCESFEDVEWMLARGSYGGIASTTEITSLDEGDDALEMGRWMARLLNQGFTLRSAVKVVEKPYPDRMEYTILGDGGISLVQTESVQPYVANIITQDGELYDVGVQTYPTSTRSIGSYASVNMESNEPEHLTPGRLPAVRMSQTELIDFLTHHPVPLNFDENYLWSDLFNPDRHF